jgi:hypothetical protein
MSADLVNTGKHNIIEEIVKLHENEFGVIDSSADMADGISLGCVQVGADRD